MGTETATGTHTFRVSAGELVRQVNDLLQASLAESTFNTYQSTWFKFQDFVREVLGCTFEMPVPVEWVLYFMAYQYMSGFAHATIAT